MNGTVDARVAALEWDAPDPGTWEFDASHQSTPAPATGQAVQTEAMRTGFGQTFARFGLPLSHMAMEFVNEWGYLSAFVHGAPRKGSGKPPPALVLKANQVS